MFSSNIVHPFHDYLLFDESFMPARSPDPIDHRGRKVSVFLFMKILPFREFKDEHGC